MVGSGDRGTVDPSGTGQIADGSDRAAPTGLPTHMRAAARHRYGSVAEVEIGTFPVPEPAGNEVLVEVSCAGLDRGVWHVLTGLPYLMRLTGFGLRRPRQPILGMDLAGRVVAVGADVTGPDIGDAVLGVGSGTFAQYALARADRVVPKPDRVSFGEAAAAPTSGLTAMQAVQDIGHVRPGQRVLVLGASGGVGSFCVQLASTAGAEVTGVASGAKHDLVRSLGAAHLIDYTSADPCDGSTRYDLIIDTGGRTPLAKLRRALTPDGTLVIVGGEDGDRWTGGIGRQLGAVVRSVGTKQRLTTFVSSPTQQRLERLRHALDGGLTPAVTRTYPLDDVPRAIRDLEAGRIQGKCVIGARATG